MASILMPPVFPCDAKRQKLSIDEPAANEQLTKIKCFSGILDPDVVNLRGETALTCAIKEGRSDVVERVPSHSIVHAVMEAIRFNKPQLVELLLEHNARLDKAYKNVKEILMHAVRFGKAHVVKVLLKHILKRYASEMVNDADHILTSALMSACFLGEVAIVRVLLNAGICVNTVDPETKDTPLMLSIRHYNTDLTNLLIKHKADVNAACEHGETPLLFACRFGHYCAIAQLIDAKVDVNQKNDDGQTPLMYASECGHARIAEMLIFNGAAVDETDLKGKTAFDYAINDDVTNVLNRVRQMRINLLT